MQWIFIVFLVAQVVQASKLQIFHPEDSLIEYKQTAWNSEKLHSFSKQILGFETNDKAESPITGLFDRPKALSVITISGIDDIGLKNAKTFDFVSDFEEYQIKDLMEEHFGEKMEFAVVDSSGITGSKIAKRALEEKFQELPKIHSSELVTRLELENLYKLGQAIRNMKDSNKRNAIDYYRIHIDISSTQKMTPEDKKRTCDDVSTAILQFCSDLYYTYNNQTTTIVHASENHSKIIVELKTYRERYHVTAPYSADFPAMFLIFAGLILFFIASVVSFVWFMMDEEDMAKNSISYRLSCTRVKKD